MVSSSSVAHLSTDSARDSCLSFDVLESLYRVQAGFEFVDDRVTRRTHDDEFEKSLRSSSVMEGSNRAAVCFSPAM